jgi:hypothetical protein
MLHLVSLHILEAIQSRTQTKDQTYVYQYSRRLHGPFLNELS